MTGNGPGRADERAMAEELGTHIRDLTGTWIGLDTGFFTAGMTSATLVALHARLHDTFPDLSVTQLFKYPTRRALARFLSTGGGPGEQRDRVTAERPEVGDAPRQCRGREWGEAGTAMEPIAVVGMACRFPGAADVDEFWRNLVAGKECITFFTPEELRAAGMSERKVSDPAHVAAAPVMSDPEYFDAALFGMTPREAELCDPQIRTFIEVCHGAAEHAGYDAFAFGEGVGVFATVGHNHYLPRLLRADAGRVGGPANAHLLLTLNDADYAATAVSYRLNLTGPSMTIHTACSSALAAVHLACQSLRAGECDAALAGGAVIEIPPAAGYQWVPDSVYSADGHCRPFSADATGTIFGSGAGAVLLKRLSDAQADGDDIKAVIRASAVNNDGSDKVSFGAPSLNGQAEVVRAAMALADTAPAAIDYVEAHATGTRLGDPVEIAALNEAYQALTDTPLAPRSIMVGSVKSNIGHLNQVAGIAGLIKTVLMLEREAVPATIGVGAANPRLGLADKPFTVVAELTPWPRAAARTRTAAVTSLGIGGANVHAILSEGPQPVRAAGPTQEADHRVVVFSGQTAPAREEAWHALTGFFATEPPFADAAGTLLHGRTAHAYRGAVVCSSSAHAAQLLGTRGTGGPVTGEAVGDLAVAYLFPGQGAHRPRMAAGLYGVVRSFTVVMDECLAAFEDLGLQLQDAWLDGGQAALTDPRVAQPLLFAVEYALASLWDSVSLRPAAVLGHSVGELTAATVAGVLSFADATKVVAARARAMQAHPVDGGLLAVSGPSSALDGLLDTTLAIAAINGTRQTVVSGPLADLRDLAARLAGTGLSSRHLDVSHAFHHPGWAAARESFLEVFASVTLSGPRIPMYSGRTGERVGAEQATDPRFWADQLTTPVLFGPASSALLTAGLGSDQATVLEVGPGHTLSQLVRPQLGATPGVAAVASLEGAGDDVANVLTAAARLWVRGGQITWTALGQHEPRTRLAVPGYPYQRRRHWIDVPETAAPTPTAHRADPADPDPAVPPFSTVVWRRTEELSPSPRQAGTALVLLPAEEEAAALVLRAVQRTGLRTVQVVPGAGYSQTGTILTVNPARPNDLSRVMNQLREQGIVLDVLVHASSAAAWEPAAVANVDGQLAAGYASLHHLAKYVLLAPASGAPRLVVVTRRSVDVTGSEQVDPMKAALHGLMRTVLSEAPKLLGGVIDIGERVSLETLSAELAKPGREAVIALRGRRRWAPAEVPHPVPATGAEPLHEDGVYLITGGFGGLGMVLARRLADTGLRPRLILLGRTGPTPATAAALEELRLLGARVHAAACDVTDLAALRTVLAEATAAFGALNGVFHLAGQAGSQMVAFRDDEAATAVLAPKVVGTLNIEELLADAPTLDFVVHYSSRAATKGLVGGADYAAANAFLDAMAVESGLASGHVLSVGWPVFADVGMAIDAGVDVDGLAATVAQLGGSAQVPAAAITGAVTWECRLHATTHWMLDEHRVDRIPLLPGTSYLDMLVRVMRERVCPDAGGPVVLEDVVFRSPFHDTEVRVLRLSFRPSGDGYEFTVTSRPDAQESAAWITHVTGRAHRAPRGQAVEPVDVAGLRARFELTGDNAGTTRVRSAFTLGPRWRNVIGHQTAGDELLVHIALAAPFHGDLDDHVLHPALLDTATASVRKPGQRSAVPFLYRRLVCHADLPAAFMAHVRRHDTGADTAVGDLDLFGEDGDLLVSIEGFTMREVDMVTAWAQVDPGPAASPTAAPAAAVDGLDPETGVDLLLALLSARSSGAVLVRPYRGGAPVPLTQAPADAVVAAQASTAATEPAPAPATNSRATIADRLRALWADALGLSTISDDQDFFEAGGNSLTAIDVLARMRDAFGIDLSIGLLLDTRTIGGLVTVLREQGAT
jgi:phthiocerol/phenolphthiocerol synthesis type-I polyketide synthase E